MQHIGSGGELSRCFFFFWGGGGDFPQRQEMLQLQNETFQRISIKENSSRQSNQYQKTETTQQQQFCRTLRKTNSHKTKKPIPAKPKKPIPTKPKKPIPKKPKEQKKNNFPRLCESFGDKLTNQKSRKICFFGIFGSFGIGFFGSLGIGFLGLCLLVSVSQFPL